MEDLKVEGTGGDEEVRSERSEEELRTELAKVWSLLIIWFSHHFCSLLIDLF